MNEPLSIAHTLFVSYKSNVCGYPGGCMYGKLLLLMTGVKDMTYLVFVDTMSSKSYFTATSSPSASKSDESSMQYKSLKSIG